MKSLPLGNSDITCSVIGFGAWAIGGGEVWGDSPDDTESIKTLHEAIERGIVCRSASGVNGR